LRALHLRSDRVNRLIEIRSYKPEPDAAAAFHGAVVSSAMPMLNEWGAEVVAFGPSAHEPDAYFLIRAYDEPADLNARQDAFYASEAWRQGPRDAIVSRIESYLSSALRASPATIEGLRRSNASASAL
jgi:hypothetical protein